MFERTRKTWREFIWRGLYAGRTMEVTRCHPREAWRQAAEALELYGRNMDAIDPRELADKRIRLWKK